MKVFDWNKMNTKDKEGLKGYTLILGSIDLDEKRIEKLTRKKVILGCFKESFIDGLGGDSFRTLSIDKAMQYASSKTIFINYHSRDSINLITELQPTKVVMTNGSWNGPIHYRKEYWKCVDLKIPLKLTSSVLSEKTKRFTKFADLYKDKIYSDKDLLEIAKMAAKESHCWQAQVGCVIARRGKVLAVSCNYVLPYETYCMQNGCIREQLHLNPGQDTQICMANHAESDTIDYCVKNGIDLDEADIFINLGPCPVCAKLIARSGIKRAIYGEGYQNSLGEKILRDCNIIFQQLN